MDCDLNLCFASLQTSSFLASIWLINFWSLRTFFSVSCLAEMVLPFFIEWIRIERSGTCRIEKWKTRPASIPGKYFRFRPNLSICRCDGFRYQPVWPDFAIYWTLGNFLKPLATIDLQKSPTFLGNFCRGVKIYHISSEIIFGQPW